MTKYLGKAQVLIEELTLAGRLISLDEQNLYIFRGLRPELRSLVSSLSTRGLPVTLSFRIFWLRKSLYAMMILLLLEARMTHNQFLLPLSRGAVVVAVRTGRILAGVGGSNRVEAVEVVNAAVDVSHFLGARFAIARSHDHHLLSTLFWRRLRSSCEYCCE